VTKKVSIIIPSRDRAIYLEHSLKTATDIKDPNIEILISDNASIDHTKDLAMNCADPRVRYVNTGKRVSMRQNFEFAVRQSKGDYLIMMGDDDGMIPGQFPVLRHILETETPETLSWDFRTYGWPIEKNGKSGGLRIAGQDCFGTPFQIDAATRLNQLEAGEIANNIPLPALYHGCMSRAFLEKISSLGAPIFRARSPDLYISFRALQAGGNFWHIHHPLSINGFSPASTGGAMNNLNPKSNKKDTQFLQEAKLDDVDDILPVTKSMSLAFLGTLETVRHLYPDQPVSPDYLKWYGMALQDVSRKDAQTAREIQASLDGHAEQFGAQTILEQARNTSTPFLARVSSTIRKATRKFPSFRCGCEIGGQNTIATAAQICDDLFQNHAMGVISGQITPRKAWQNCKFQNKQLATKQKKK